MDKKEELIGRFYTAFQKLDYRVMQECYSPDIVFSDPVFGLLEGAEPGAMWEMLCRNARDFSLRYGDFRSVDEEYASCKWTATYTFSKTGRIVVNQVDAFMRIRDGQIVEHSDRFNMWKWSRQALGLRGLLLGWSGLVQNKVHAEARRSLEQFMKGSAPTQGTQRTTPNI